MSDEKSKKNSDDWTEDSFVPQTLSENRPTQGDLDRMELANLLMRMTGLETDMSNVKRHLIVGDRDHKTLYKEIAAMRETMDKILMELAFRK